MHYLTRIFLGRDIPNGASPAVGSWVEGAWPGDRRRVRPEAFDAFIADTVATAFPDGFTVIHAEGGWRDVMSGKLYVEPIAVVELCHSGSVTVRRKVKDVAVTYRQRFGQDAVMVSTTNLTEGVEFV